MSYIIELDNIYLVFILISGNKIIKVPYIKFSIIFHSKTNILLYALN